MLAPNPPDPPAGLQPPQAAQNPPALPEQGEEEEEPSEPTYSIFGGNDGGNQIIQFQMAPGQCVMLNSSTTSSSVLYAHPEVSVYESYESRSSLSGPKFDYYENYGRQPLIYFRAAAPHAGKILPIILHKARVALLVQDDCCLANKGRVAHEAVCLKTGANTEQQLQMTRFVAKPFEWPSRMRGATVFVHAPGSIMETNLGSDESMHACISAIVAVTEGVTLKLPVTSASTHLAEKKDVCVVHGPGTVYISSLPVSIAGRDAAEV